MTDGADDLALLTGPDAEELLEAAVATADGRLVSWSARQIDHRPGHSTTVSYRARVAWADGEREVTLGASTGLGPVESCPPGVIVLSDGARQVGVWLFPLDPGLPALAAAHDPDAVEALLDSFGVPSSGVSLQLRAYRPRRRAVIEVRTTGARLFLKVLRPDKVAAMHGRHRMLHDAGVPVPQSLGWNDDGLLVLAALDGVPLRERLRDGTGQIPDGTELIALLERFPDAVRDLPKRAAWSESTGHFAGIIGSALPEEAGRVDDLAGRITDGLSGCSDSPDAVHGDLYEAQLLLSGREVTGVLDVDTPQDRGGGPTTSPASYPIWP